VREIGRNDIFDSCNLHHEGNEKILQNGCCHYGKYRAEQNEEHNHSEALLEKDPDTS
jgi:hypothetical protein